MHTDSCTAHARPGYTKGGDHEMHASAPGHGALPRISGSHAGRTHHNKARLRCSGRDG
jgi:hypothetical protein